MQRAPKSMAGFTLLELMLAAFSGLLVVGGAVTLYSRTMKASFITSEKSEMQQDLRAAASLMQADISQAGAGALGQQGLQNNGVGLPNGAGSTKSIYPCSTVSCTYVNGGSVAYPLSPSGVPTLYSIIPGPSLGITVNAATGASDILTVSSADPTLTLNCYSGSIDATGTIVTLQAPTVQPATCILPQLDSGTTETGLAYPQNLMDANVGLQSGDMVLFGTSAVGVVTGISACAPTAGNAACYTVTFAATDIGKINQPGTSGSLTQFAAGPLPASATPVRLMFVTYYLDLSPMDGVTPRLMRIQNGRLPAPVAENVVDLKFTYDVNNDGKITANISTLPAGTTPGMITQVNIAHLAIRSQLPGITGYQGFDLQTGIAARNLTFLQTYPITPSN
jgi:type II secretory pathway pseudopilin PulG